MRTAVFPTMLCVVICVLILPAPVVAQEVIKLENESTDRCLNIHRGRHDFEGGPVTSYTCADTPDQEWSIRGLSNGNVKLKNISTDRCLNIHREEHDFEGGPVTSYTCADTPDQEWELIWLPNGNMKLKNQSTDRCLNIHRGRHDFEGGPVTSYTCADTPDQEWVLMEASDGIWENAGQDEFFIHPKSSAEHCVTDVQPAFETIEFGRSRGKNFFSDRIWGADSGHMQGVARLPGGWLIQSYTEGVFLTHFPSKDGSGHSVWATEPDHGHPHIPPSLNSTFEFRKPRIRFSEPRVDWCRDWGTNCGKPAADRFCQIKGYTASIDFAKESAVDFVTQVLVGGRRCDGSSRHCDSFKNIKCVAAGAAARKHVGGVHAYHDIVVVPSDTEHDSRVELFKHNDGDLALLSKFDVSEHQSDAHYASILPLDDGDWLLAVGHDSRKPRGPHRIHFYVIPSLTADQDKLRYLGRWGRGRTRDDFQSASLIADCNGDVFIIGTGTKGRTAVGRKHAKLYQVLSFTRSGGRRPKVEVNKLKERDPRSERNDCNLNAGATFFPTSDRALSMYCTEKEIRHGQITTREYRDED